MKLANPDPYDLTELDLDEFKGIIAPLSWPAVSRSGWATATVQTPLMTALWTRPTGGAPQNSDGFR